MAKKHGPKSTICYFSLPPLVFPCPRHLPKVRLQALCYDLGSGSTTLCGSPLPEVSLGISVSQGANGGSFSVL